MEQVLPFLVQDFQGKPVWAWLSFLSIIVALIAFDLGLFNRKSHVISFKESMIQSTAYVAIALAFGGWVWSTYGEEHGVDFITAYLVEYTLALDNIFIIALVFTYFAIPREYQHRVLFWGILGVIVLRAIMISLGAVLIHEFHYILYVFGAFLVFTGLKMLLMVGQEPDMASNPVLNFLKRNIRISNEIHGDRFFVRLPAGKTGGLKLHATPLFLALCVIEFADIVFALDSVPAVFLITEDTFIVYTSNIFAIMGLRALFFALSAMINRFHYLKYALALVLVFIGGKIFAAMYVGKIPAEVSLGVTAALLIGGVVVSMIVTAWQGQGKHASNSEAGSH